ncbi:hypothetical protein STRAU_3339 [Streptomyces aurantiacus JA 4570]|uniref:Uncharacterized protein n=1 Tax=Streptomyces aurantiacus JA 4570 TaxID=1286094 RepID=S3ZJ63_9ACTN|nr:hypothetical protein STRAU_3339 [Streptomyces aurantiacus JA 4570]
MVIGAAVLLFIASFLDTFDSDGADSDKLPTAWDNGNLLMSVYLLGVIGAALIIVGRGMGQQRKVVGLDLGQVGVVFTIAAAWSSLGAIFDVDQSFGFLFEAGGFGGGGEGPEAGMGLILGLIATLVMAGAAVATLIVPALKAPLAGGAPRPAPQPYGGQPQGGGYGYPGAQAGQPGQPGQPYGAQPGQPQQSFGGQPAAGGQTPPPAQAQQAGAPAADFSPFWFAASAVPGGRLADPDRRTGPRHLVLGRGAARPEPGGADAGRPPRRAAGHHGDPARLISPPYTSYIRPLALPGGGPLPYSPAATRI